MEQDAEAVPWWIVLAILLFGLLVVAAIGALLFGGGSLLSVAVP